MRNLAAKPENRQALMAFPGIVPVLERLAQESAQGETQHRAAKALELMMQSDDKQGSSGRGGGPSRGRATPLSLSRSSSPGGSATSSTSRSNGRSSSPPASAALVSRGRRGDCAHARTNGHGAAESGARGTLLASKGDRGSPHMPVNSFSRRSASNSRGASRGRWPDAMREGPRTGRAASADTVISSVESESGWSTAESEKPVVSSTSGMSSAAYSSPTGFSGEERVDYDLHAAASKPVDAHLLTALLLGPAGSDENNDTADGKEGKQNMAGNVGAVTDGEECKAVDQVTLRPSCVLGRSPLRVLRSC